MIYHPKPLVAELMAQATDYAITELLQQIAASVDDDGTLDFNKLLHRVVPTAMLLFLMKCPRADLLAMIADLKAEAARIQEPNP